MDFHIPYIFGTEYDNFDIVRISPINVVIYISEDQVIQCTCA